MPCSTHFLARCHESVLRLFYAILLLPAHFLVTPSAHHVTVQGPVTASSMHANQLMPSPQCQNLFVHHLSHETGMRRIHGFYGPAYRPLPSPVLLEGLSADQC